MPVHRPPETLGPVGLILPTFVQESAPAWARPHEIPGAGRSSADGDGAAPGTLAWLAGVCTAAEEAGASALWACDHLFWHGPCLECLTVLTVAATATRRAVLGTSVLQLPLRRAGAVAKQAATVQVLSGGRLVLGVGVGSHPGEYDQAGAAYHTRGHDLDTGIDELRRVWRSGEGVLRADVADRGPERYRQLPATRPVPVWVGGSSEPALRRAARRADGWMPLFLSVEEYAAAVERLAKEVDGAGRPAEAVVASMVLFVSVSDDGAEGVRRGTAWMSSLYGLPPKAFTRHLVAGTAPEVARVVAAYRRAGAEHVVVYVTSDDPIEQFTHLMSALPAAGVPVGA